VHEECHRADSIRIGERGMEACDKYYTPSATRVAAKTQSKYTLDAAACFRKQGLAEADLLSAVGGILSTSTNLQIFSSLTICTFRSPMTVVATHDSLA
jgi:hypothetical protein